MSFNKPLSPSSHRQSISLQLTISDNHNLNTSPISIVSHWNCSFKPAAHSPLQAVWPLLCRIDSDSSHQQKLRFDAETFAFLPRSWGEYHRRLRLNRQIVEHLIRTIICVGRLKRLGRQNLIPVRQQFKTDKKFIVYCNYFQIYWIYHDSLSFSYCFQ